MIKQQREWLIEQLAKFGLEQVDELVDYLLQCEDEAVLEEYLSGLLGKSEKTEAFLQELFGEQKSIRDKKEPENVVPSSSTNNIVKGDRKIQRTKGRKKSNFYSKSSKISSIEKGENSCVPFIPNCLCCGKVIMEQTSSCNFCGWSPVEDYESFGKTLWGETFREAIVNCSRSKGNRYSIATGHEGYGGHSEYMEDSSDSEELDEMDYEILSKKERLLELERNPTERLKVFDENVDYFDLSSYSELDDEQKRKVERKREEQNRIAKEREEGVRTTFDIEGKLVYHSERSERPYFNPLLPGPSPLFIAASPKQRNRKG
ncbi:hypothetical protein GpartN1_g1209.t1 [Galdieria partita]|uniref:Activating signal cointegrator 1 N-terminal domain-containing protein n=1 Tax=Galdieria partita TaxID=83374 RepID=A0A9C7PRP6_9RHOD|nr:hypothetical protein GpartN1_g1209.t1 [Galdieria partita]